MKILMMTNTYTPIVGGVEKSIESLTSQIRKKGHTVLIVAPTFEGMPEDEEGVVRVPAIRKFNGSDFSVQLPISIELSKTLNDFQPDIVHSHHPFLMGDTALRVANKFQIPLVFTHHTKYEDYTHYVPLDSPLMKRFVIELSTGYANLAHHVIAPSQSIYQLLVKRGVQTPIDVIPTGIDLALFSGGQGRWFRSRWKIPEHDFVIGHVGRLAPEKNVDFLARAVTRMMKKNNRVRFLLVGKGASLEDICGIFRAEGLEERLHVTGTLAGEELTGAYHAMDVFAFASTTETQGMVLAEAVATGTPVVAINSDGVREVVRDRVNGRMIEHENLEDFSAALEWVTQCTPDQIKALKKECLVSSREFDLEKMTDRILSLYDDLISKDLVYTDTDDTVWSNAAARLRTEWNLIKNITQSAGTALTPEKNKKKSRFDGKYLPSWARSVRQWLDKHEWSRKLLKLPVTSEYNHTPGLVMIQIDGLSLKQLQKAMTEGRAPFMQSLLKNERYVLHPQYSGLPSTTPSVQGELFYGVKQIVPAFCFYDQQEKDIFIMYNDKAAIKIEERLKEKGGRPLLAGGSSYANVYSGGADEAHFCAVSLGWSGLWTDINPFNFLLLVSTHFIYVLKVIILVTLEILLATFDFVSGLIKREDVLKEFKFIPTRALICILLRDLSTIGAKIDMMRGLPVIHLNYLGYDEQAHRRGPYSKYAHKTLGGIDYAIRTIYKQALHSARRNYDVWIYSDHGQEDVRSYTSEHGRTVQEAVQAVLKNYQMTGPKTQSHERRGVRHQRARYVFSFITRILFPFGKFSEIGLVDGQLITTAVGPTGNIYLPGKLESHQQDKIARDLVHIARIPLVMAAGTTNKTAIAWNDKGQFNLPHQAKEVFGENHPYLSDIAADIISLVHHPNAGAFVFSGWRPGQRALSFPVEHGAHAGPGEHESDAFVLLPKDIDLLSSGKTYSTIADLRAAALDFLGHHRPEKPGRVIPARVRDLDRIPGTLRVMTYNVHSCIGMDGKISAERIARSIGRHAPDIVALQEVDMHQPRTGRIDQPHSIARYLEMFYHFHPNLGIEKECYGNAILSRYPLKIVRAGRIGTLRKNSKLEPRGAIWAQIIVDGQPIEFISTHLGLKRWEQLEQTEALLGPDWLGHPDCGEEVILCGDLNSFPGSPVCRQFSQRLSDAQQGLDSHTPHPTWYSRYPVGRIDHVFIGSAFQVVRVEVSQTEMDKIASDHLPLIVDIKLKTGRLTGQRS